MRTRMEACRLELMPHVRECGFRLIRHRHIASSDQSIDVEHAEPDPFHMKRPNRELERFAFLEYRVLRSPSGLAVQTRDQELKTVFGGFPVVDVGGHGLRASCCRQR
jgi:hypothetical protein